MASQTHGLATTYAQDGVVFLPNALSADTLALAETCYDWSLAHPTPSANEFYTSSDGTFYQDLCHPDAARAYEKLLVETNVADLVADVWGTPDVWFLYEQVFVKEGGDTRRTPWHQDAPYLAVEGDELAVMWINFEPVPQAQSLEFVRGSHKGTLYDGSAFDETDDTVPVFGHGLPRLPDIEAHRDDWDIVSFAIAPGDVVIFHPATLHGGAPTQAGGRRRTLSLRFFGAHATYAQRPDPAPAPLVAGLHDALNAGDPFRHAAFPMLRPAASGFDQIPHLGDGHVVTVQQKLQGGT